MCTATNEMEKSRYKMMRYKRRMAESITTTDYNFYKELYEIAKMQYKKFKQVLAS